MIIQIASKQMINRNKLDVIARIVSDFFLGLHRLVGITLIWITPIEGDYSDAVIIFWDYTDWEGLFFGITPIWGDYSDAVIIFWDYTD